MTPVDTSLRTSLRPGQLEVPTDVAILVDATHLGVIESHEVIGPVPQDLCTLHDAKGDAVAVTIVQVAASHIEVRPVAALEPNTNYALAVNSLQASPAVGVQTLTFTTGTGPFADEVEAPRVVTENLRIDGEGRVVTYHKPERASVCPRDNSSRQPRSCAMGQRMGVCLTSWMGPL